MPRTFQDELLARHLRAYLGDIGEGAMALLSERLEWVELAAGQVLMTQGEPGDAMYLSISGRLRAYFSDDDGSEHLLREMARGQIIGEMSLFTDEPRSATVVAIRDSVLVRLDKAEFLALLASSAPVSIALTRQIIRRLQSPQARSELASPVAMGLLPITTGTQAADFSERFAEQLRHIGTVCIVDAQGLDRALAQPGLARSGADDVDANRRIALHLDEVEAQHDFVLLLADDSPTPWTERCSRHCDEILLLADAAQAPELHPTEARYLTTHKARSEAAEVLVLLHPADLACPSGTRAWLARRPVADHIHIRPTLDRDMARLARVQSRTAVGLVFAGGGARGCAHLGVYRALREAHIEVDCVGGTSIGAIMAALVASDRPPAEITGIARKAFSVNPTRDFNLIPLLSLIAGKRLRRTAREALHTLLGHDADVEDLWKNYYCVTSNYSQAREQVVTRGKLFKGLMASIAIPGALPPVPHDGDLLCDGGTFNNFPVDVMRGMRGIGRVIGVDLSVRKPRRIEHDEVPDTWALLRDRLRPRRHRRYKFPSLMSYLMNVTILYSSSRQRSARKLTDLYFNPPLERIGLLQWEKFDSIVRHGHEHGMAVLQEQSDAALAAWRARAA
ncbi:MAG: cyclic nucleotide-binding domain-containing protein [Rubrivivax sp.]|jgi:NTE family protein|nr:cyclic nucleotide-binding domain-containing protein [Rubrivivax sp.]